MVGLILNTCEICCLKFKKNKIRNSCCSKRCGNILRNKNFTNRKLEIAKLKTAGLLKPFDYESSHEYEKGVYQ
jgi:hypothetical protein